MLFRARQFEFRFPRPALVMGIVNVTPDSFSDGGQFLATESAVAHALKLVEEGAEILDIGGESTRPGAEPVSEAEELRRVIPVIEKLTAKTKVALAIDTTKPAVARAALAAGASIVNDVAANRSDEAMWKIVAEFKAGYIAMHAGGGGASLSTAGLHHQTLIGQAQNLSQHVADYFVERLERLNAVGICADQVVFDPGIGFGKTLEENLELLAGLRGFTTLRRPLLLGASRKSFIGKLLGAEVDERLPASLACAILAVADGVQIIRTHDVAETVQAIRLTEALLARRKN
jgi:dihydropteroate synthase